MSYRPSRPLVFGLVPLLAIGGATVWAWSRTKDPAPDRSAHGAVAELATKSERVTHPETADSPAGHKSLRQGSAAMKEKMLREHPGLRIGEIPIPDEENAYLLLLRLGMMPEESRPKVTESLKELLDGRIPWDLAKAKEILAENADFLALAEKVGAMTERSSAHLPESHNGFFGARPTKEIADILMLKGRIAAEEGDGAEALRLVTASGNLGRHLRGVEHRTLLSETVAILTDLNLLGSSFEHLLPRLGPGTDLGPWKESFATHAYTTADFAAMMRGEWHVTAEHYLYPAILRQKPAAGEKLVSLHATNFEKLVNELPGMSLQQFARQGVLTLGDGMDGFTGETGKMAEGFLTGNAAWHKGYLRATSVVAIHQAALDLLILEQRGETLTPQSIAKLPPDPVSGKVYHFDPATRTLSPPEELKAANVSAVKLPW